MADEYRERVAVTAPTRLDWTFAVVKQSRANPPPEWIGRDYDSTQQTYELFAPNENPWGEKRPLVLFISHTDQAKGWQSWSEVCRRYNVIFAGPHGAGKRQKVARRMRVVLDVLDDVRQRYSVDPDRTYLCGFSGGAHIACAMGYLLPEYFGGVIAIGGGEVPPRELWLRHQIADRLSVAFIRSSRESDRRELFYSTVFSPLAALYGTRTRSYSRSPRQIPDSQLLAKALRWADAGVEQRRQLAVSFASTRVGNEDVASREQQAQRVLTDAKKRLIMDETVYAGLLQLEGICQRWPDIGVSKEAQRILDDHKNRQLRPWRDRRMVDREAAFLANESAYNSVHAMIHGHGRWRLSMGHSRYPEEHSEMTWVELPAQGDQAGEENAEYDDATQALLERLGGRVGLDRRGRVNMMDLSGTLVTARQFRKLRERLLGMTDLRALDLSTTVMRGSVLSQLSELTNLHAVNLSHTDITNSSLASLSGLHELQFMAVVHTNVSSLRRLGSPRNLRVLILGATNIDDAALSWLTGAAELRRLSLFSTRVTDRAVAKLRTLPKLEYLNLSLTRITNAACLDLARMAPLKGLILDNTQISDPGLAALNELDRLRHLSLTGNNVTDAGLQHIHHLNALRTLDLKKTKVTQRGIADLQAVLPELQIEWNGSENDAKRKARDRIHMELLLRRFDDQYRLKLLEYQRRYFGFSIDGAEHPL